jgi:hypothetical protein
MLNSINPNQNKISFGITDTDLERYGSKEIKKMAKEGRLNELTEDKYSPSTKPKQDSLQVLKCLNRLWGPERSSDED